jgi:SAM-dependent methyltransferase
MRTAPELPRLYGEFADWWLLMSPPVHYVEEAQDLLRRLKAFHQGSATTMLELGSGGGSLAYHLKRDFALTLTDLSPGMLGVNRAVNPECEHYLGDMRALRLDRTFDVVLIHDAVMYMTTPHDLQAALQTAAVHCREGGTVVVLPDYVKETFEPGTDSCGEDGDDGRALRCLEWVWDPNPADNTYVADYVYALRSPDGHVVVEHDRHVEGLFSREQWIEWFHEAGIEATSSIDAWDRDVFLGRRVADGTPLT